MTAVLSCVLLGLWLVGAVFEARRGYFRFVMAVGMTAVATSGMPLLMGMDFCSVTGGGDIRAYALCDGRRLEACRDRGGCFGAGECRGVR